MKTNSLKIVIIAAVLSFAACSTIGTSSSTSAVIGTSEQIVNAVLPIAASIYGTNAAGDATSAFLYSLENQLNPRVGLPASTALAQASNNAAMVKAAAPFIKSQNKVSAKDTAIIDAAAVLVAAIPVPASTPIPAQTSNEPVVTINGSIVAR